MTKGFNFSLQKVLNVREMVEDAKAVELKKAQAAAEHEKQKLTQARAEKDKQISSSGEDNQHSKTSLHDLNNRTAYVDQLSDRIDKLGESVSKREQDAEEQRLAYVQASKEKMVIEKLKEHHQDTFRKKQNREQVKAESEVASRISHKAGEA